MVHWECLATHAVEARPSVTALQAKTLPPVKPKLTCINTNCGRTGHTINNCYWRGGGKEGQFPPNFGKRGRTTAGNATHMANMANTSSDDVHVTYTLAAQSLPQYAPTGIYNKAMETVDVYLSKFTPATVTAYRANKADVVTYTDSGASNHCFV
ncbi:hypothetical protein C0991_001614 [Blastosporella zonata]|nr:hypothetical protein C0991_001614 [Blastosporella zonata]